jgi:DNA-binding transcriptional LysR family regulator
MNLRTIQYFVTTAEALHVGRAAEQLGIAQPALSQQIRVLEAELGVQLFRRAHRRIELTEAGRVYLDEARQLLATAQRAVRLARAAERGAAGELHIGYSGSAIFEPRLRDLLSRFRAAYPAVTLLLHESTVEEHLAQLQQKRLDIAFVRGPVGPLHPDMKAQTFTRSPLVAALPAEHRLARSPAVSPLDLADDPFIALMDSPGIGLEHSLARLGERAGFLPRVMLRTGSVMSMLGLVGAGLGVGVIPRLPLEFSSSSFVITDLDDEEAVTEVLLLTRRHMSSAAEERFLEMIRDQDEKAQG